LENSINDLIWVINGKTISDGRSDTQDLDIKKLLSALQHSVSTKLGGSYLKAERKAITDIITTINKFKSDRNLVVHGTWGEVNGVPSVGSLRLETDHDNWVTFESFDHERLKILERAATDATKSVSILRVRLEALIKTSS
jgi:hypothetical protein